MIYEVQGDILLSEAQGMAHGVAPNDDFKKGLAFSLKENWPALYKDFRHYSKGNHPKEGTMWSWMGPNGQKVYNLFTQEHAPASGQNPGKATPTYVNHALKELRKAIETDQVQSLALPKVATGVGG